MPGFMRRGSAQRSAATFILGAGLVASVAGLGAVTASTAGAIAKVTLLPRLPSKTSVSPSFAAVAVVPHSKDAFAVGSWYTETGSGDVIEEWNGSAWKEMTPPTLTGATQAGLNGVWAASASDVWAVGSISTTSTQTLQLIHWNGKAWSSEIVTGVPAGASLSAISGSSASNIWAVGSSLDDLTETASALELHFGGTSWRSTSEGPADGFLYGVAVASATKAWIVGAGGSKSVPFVLDLEGTTWKQVGSPAPKDGYLSGVSASGSTAWAVGGVSGSKTSTLFAMEWTGSKWVSEKVPSPTGVYPRMTAVTVSSSLAWLAGVVSNTKNTDYGAFVEKFTKGKWSVGSLPVAGNGSYIGGLAAAASSDVWGVGSDFTGKICSTPERTITYHYTSSWKLVATPSFSASTAHC